MIEQKIHCWSGFDIIKMPIVQCFMQQYKQNIDLRHTYSGISISLFSADVKNNIVDVWYIYL